MAKRHVNKTDENTTNDSSKINSLEKLYVKGKLSERKYWFSQNLKYSVMPQLTWPIIWEPDVQLLNVAITC